MVTYSLKTIGQELKIMTHSLPFPGEKIMRDQVSSYKNVDEKIIGQKLSFLALTSENKVEFYSHSEEVGLKVLMTMEGLHRYVKTTLKTWFKSNHLPKKRY
jgi:hypothetical protein